jgi:hypothetical protein
MSGPENLRGMDYQVAYSIYASLQSITGVWKDISSLQFESLDEDEEDFNLVRTDGLKEYFQIKKKCEGYHWTPGELKKIFKSFSEKDSETVAIFFFITNAGGNTEVVKLKKALEEQQLIPENLLNQFRPTSIPKDKFIALLKKIKICTRSFPSNDDAQPALHLEREIKLYLCKYPIRIDEPVNSIYDNLWKFVFDIAKQAKKITLEELLSEVAPENCTVF